jgi:hypothetical protein
MRAAVLLLLALIPACAASGPDRSGGGPIARVTSTSAKADGAAGAATWEVYADGSTMTWVATDFHGLETSRLTFRDEGDAVFLDVESGDIAFESIGVDLDGAVIAGPDDEEALRAVADLVAEAVNDSGALVADDGKADGSEVPAACREARELTAGMLLRICASSFGAYFRLFTGRGYDDGLTGVLQVLADVFTPHMCVSGMGELVRAPGSLTRYCRDPARLQIARTAMSCRSDPSGWRLCDLDVDVGIDRALPADLGESLWVSADVYDAAGERRGFGFPRQVSTGRWATTLTVWDTRPGETLTVRATADVTLSATSTITVPR